MKWGIFFLLLSVTAWTPIATADTTYVQGSVLGTWTADHSPYVVQGDLNVATGCSLHIRSGVTVFFDGHFELRVDSLAVLSAEGAAGDSIRFTTDTLTHPERWRGIRIHHGADTSRFRYCVLEFAAGDSSAQSDDTSGGALYAHNSCLELSHCGLYWNRAPVGNGGAAFFDSCALQILDCRFEQNSAGDGGALYVNSCWGTIDSSVFQGNFAAVRGGAMCVFTDNAQALSVRDGLFEGNQSGRWGGAVYYLGYVPVYFERCTFRGNSTGGHGGAVRAYNAYGGFRFSDCVIDSNEADSTGGGVAFYYGFQFPGPPVFERCIISRNRAMDGGGVYVTMPQYVDGYPEIRSCVIAENSASNTGGAIGGRGPNLTLTAIVNTVQGAALEGQSWSGYWGWYCGMFGNADGNFSGGADPALNRVNLNGDSCDSNYNLYLDPLFVDPWARDYHLTAGSPYIDAGPASPYSPTDPDGTRPDIGAFYFPQGQRVDGDITLQPDALSLSAHPNPFNPVTEIRYEVSKASHVTLRVFDLLGREVALLKDGFVEAGTYRLMFDGTKLASGIYLARLDVGMASQTKKLVLLK